MALSADEKRRAIIKLQGDFPLNDSTRTIVFAHADLNMTQEPSDSIDEEVVYALQGYLNQHQKEQPCLITTPEQLCAVLESLLPCIDEGRMMQLTAIGHYNAGLELFNAYQFVNTVIEGPYIDDFKDHLFFAELLSKYSFINKFRALGCVTARIKEQPDYTSSNLCDEKGFIQKISTNGKPDIETTVKTSGKITQIIEENSLIYKIASNTHRHSSQSLFFKGEAQPMFPTMEGKIVAAKSQVIFEDDRPIVNTEKLAQMYQEISAEKAIYPKSVLFEWPEKFFSPAKGACDNPQLPKETLGASVLDV